MNPSRVDWLLAAFWTVTLLTLLAFWGWLIGSLIG